MREAAQEAMPDDESYFSWVPASNVPSVQAFVGGWQSVTVDSLRIDRGSTSPSEFGHAEGIVGSLV
jgi:hypothetical protein